LASEKVVGEIYDYIDELWRATFGENADFSNPLYDVDFSKSMEQAQKDKHAFVLRGLRFVPGAQVLDIGCGWGAMMKAVEAAGGRAVGLTVSRRQAEACRRAGLDARVLDWRSETAWDLGRFDGIVSLGAFEHFCSVEEYRSGKQDLVYERFFRLCHHLLEDNGRLYLQTMLWGKNAPSYNDVSVHAKKGSSEYILAVMETLFPDSCLPFSLDQLERDASPYFELIENCNGRLEYPYAIEDWCRRLRRLNARKLWIYLKMGRRLTLGRTFLYQLESARNAYNAECFRREIMNHERMFFEKRSVAPVGSHR